MFVEHGADPFSSVRVLRFSDAGAELTWSAVEHLFYNGNFPACQALVEAAGGSSRLFTQGQLFNMYQLAWEAKLQTRIGEELGSQNLSKSARPQSTIRALERLVGANLDNKWKVTTRKQYLRCPLAIIYPLRFGEHQLVKAIWGMGIAPHLFLNERPLEHLHSVFGSEPVQLGTAILELAILARAPWLVASVLSMGQPIKPRPRAMLLAVSDGQTQTVGTLISSGLPVHVPDEPMKQSRGFGALPRSAESVSRSWTNHEVLDQRTERVDECKNPVRLAIQPHAGVGGGKNVPQVLRVLLDNAKDRITPSCGSMYLKEASRRLQPEVLTYLLQHQACREMRQFTKRRCPQFLAQDVT
ncbi:hypothetical protein B0T21DRAFT_453578 [Apiosordaria backusii]|uniref:Uncharacterized protein n=1 Tax=Apiosordaria backusii TaxID=314023 RepID=A0AA40AXY4_9PEZI|nr:hypothetical protein B0T21DRAFT_453578 [Apiosordaria backusii]